MIEVKVYCPCGAKFKFDVEPYNGRMPYSVSCPTCKADRTEEANAVIQQQLAASAPPDAANFPVTAPPAPAPASAPGLRISTAPAHAQPASGAPPPFATKAPPPFAAAQKVPQTSATKMKSVGKYIVSGVVVVAIVVGKIVLIRLARVAAGVGAAAVIGSTLPSATEDAPAGDMNLTADNQVILYVKHTNSTEVANSFSELWTKGTHRKLKITDQSQDSGEGAEYAVYPEHNGYVEIMGGLDWKEAQFASMASQLSQKFRTMVFVEKDVDFSGAFVFGVYDSGSNLFNARMDASLSNGGEETYKMDHPEWVAANGYVAKGGAEGHFDMRNADAITKKFGMKMWDAKPETRTNYILLVDTAAPKQN